MINSEILLPVDQSQSINFCTSMLLTLGEFVGTYFEMIKIVFSTFNLDKKDYKSKN